MKSTFQQRTRLFGASSALTGDAGVEANYSRIHPQRKSFASKLPAWAAAAAVTSAMALSTALAGDITYDFKTDPSSILTIGGNGANTAPWQASGGNPDGFLAITYPIGSSYTGIVFPNLDPGKVVTAFTFTCDLRVGNSTGDRAADGFSISFARAGDPILEPDGINSDGNFAGNCCAETGTKTGIAVSFDTWSGNNFPNDPNDKTDIEGIIVRVDDVTVKKVSLPTRHGAADDVTSLQTGPRDAAYWAGGGDPQAPESWAGLAWRPFGITLTEDGKLTVTWKGNKVLDAFQTTYFPTAGQLVFAGRTGGANEHTHVDNIHLTTTARAVTAVPSAPPNLKVATAGARFVTLTWDAASVPGDPNAKVAYEVERDGVVVNAFVNALTYTDKSVSPGTTYTYKVRGKNIAGNSGPDSTVTAKSGVETPGFAFVKAEQWTGISATAVDVSDPHFTGDPPDRVRYVNGFSYGETSGFGDTWGDNYQAKLTAVFTAPESGNFRFFIRSDDASQLWVKQGSTPPDPQAETPVANEDGCCNGFFEPNDANPPTQTSAPIPLVAGQKYGITFIVKEGGGGDWGQVAIRKEGDPTPASQLTPLRGDVLSGPVDAAGASVAFTTQPVDTKVTANSPVSFTAAATGTSPYGADYGNAVAYQWYVGGVAVLNANGATWTTDVTPIAWAGKKVKVTASVAGATATSSEVTLTVDADTVAPTVKRVSGSPSFNSVTVTFSEPVTDPSATTVGNYSIPGLTLSNPVRVSDRVIKLTSTKQDENKVYTVTINGVRDNANNPSAYTGQFTSYQFKSGIVSYKSWQGQTGGFADFVDKGLADVPPTTDNLINSYYSNTGDQWDNYFGQVSGYFIPPKDGNYVFYLASDDHGELYLSTDSDPANKKKIAEEPQWGGRGYFIDDGTAANNSATRGDVGARSNISNEYGSTEWPTGAGGKIALKGGQKYYLEVLYKEGGGGDHGSATYKLETDPDPANGTSLLTGNLIGTFVDPGLLPPLFTQKPSTVKYHRGDTVTFTAAVDSATPVTYQWYHNKHAIAGATSATLTIPNAGVADIGDYYVDATNPNGTVSSFPDDSSRAIMLGADFVIEMEDYNFDGGKTDAKASVMPLVADIFQGKDGLPGIDFHNGSPSGGGDGDNGNSLRNGWKDSGGTVFPSPTGPETVGGNLDVIQDNGGGNTERPDFTLANNYKIGWGGLGNWYQYTRNFPAGTYNAVWVGSRDGRTADAYGRTIELVTGDITKENATTTVVGQLTFSGTGAWSSNDSIPFMNTAGTGLAEIPLGANTTVRVRISLGDGDNDYLLFYKTGTVTPPQITKFTANPDGTLTLEWTGGGKLQAAASLNGPWQDVPGATSPYTFTPSAALLFGRVVQ